MIVMNPRRGRSRRRKSGGRRRRASNMKLILRNPTTSSTIGAVKRGFSLESVKMVAPIALGAVGNVYASEWLASKLPASYRGGIVENLIGVVSAGGFLAISALVKQPALGQKLFLGGMTQVLIKSLLPYVVQFTGDPGTAFGRPIIAAAPTVKTLPVPPATVAANESAKSAQMNEFILN